MRGEDRGMVAMARGYCVVWTRANMDGHVPHITGDISTRELARQHAEHIRERPDCEVLWVGAMQDLETILECAESAI
jgi:hypothetical protein